jgi:hypothetical protein
MKLILVNLYPDETMARYLLSSYVLKAYLDKVFDDGELVIDVLNFSANAETVKVCAEIKKGSETC